VSIAATWFKRRPTVSIHAPPQTHTKLGDWQP